MIGAWLDRQVSRFDGMTLLQLLLLWLTMGCASFGLAAVIESVPFMFFPILASISLLIAWRMSRARLRNWGFGLVGTLLGILGLTLTVGGVGRTLIRLVSSLVVIPSQMIRKVPSNYSDLHAAWLAFLASLETLVARFSNWSHVASTGTPIIDPMVISILWGTALWVAVLWAFSWVQKRTHVLVGMFPIIALLGWNAYYTHSTISIVWLIFTVGGVLALQASSSYDRASQRWTSGRIDVGNIEPGLIFSVVLVSVVMVILANILPSIPIKKIADAIDDAFQEPADPSLARSLGLEQTPASNSEFESSPTPTRVAGMGTNLSSSHDIGAGPALEQDIVMVIAVDGYSPPPVDEYAAIQIQQTIPYYWRGQTYKEYNGHTWSTGNTSIREFETGQSLQVDTDSSFLQTQYISVTQHVTRFRSQDSTVFVAGELLSLGQSTGGVMYDNEEIISAYTESNPYTAFSRISSPNVEELRSAGSDYPLTILPYLHLPSDLPPRVHDLALTLTAGQETPFDKAVVLEAYLRQFPYSLDIPAPPLGRDAVDYFLFDLRKGYCDYYATAMVVMARATGLPARLVLGYSQGIYDPANEHFVIRDANAHAWVEIYFPGTGWVEFEPTPSQPNIFRPGQSPVSSQEIGELLPPGQEAPLSIHLGYSWQGRTILILLVSIAAILILLSLPLEAWWLSRLPPQQTLDAIIRRLYRRGQALGIEPNPSRTPNGFAHALTSKLEPLVVEGELASVITALETDLRYMITLYNRLLFSKYPPKKEEMKGAIQTWTRIRQGMKQVRGKKSFNKLGKSAGR